MPDNVREAVASALVAAGGMTDDEAEAHISAMEKNGSYCTETWQ